jgi:hypothetical protein
VGRAGFEASVVDDGTESMVVEVVVVAAVTVVFIVLEWETEASFQLGDGYVVV